MLGWDRQLERWTVAHRVGFLDPVIEALTYSGTYGAVWLAIGAVLAFSFRRPQIFVSTLLAALAGQWISGGLKAAIPRARPDVDALIARPHSHSFPSGHATTAFACATVLAGAVPRLRLPLLLLAAAIAWSRVYVGVHYPLDVLAGAALGAAIGLAVSVAGRHIRLGSPTADGRAGKARHVLSVGAAERRLG